MTRRSLGSAALATMTALGLGVAGASGAPPRASAGVVDGGTRAPRRRRTGGLAGAPAAAAAVVDGAAAPVYAAHPSGWLVGEAWVTVPSDSDRDGIPDRAHIRYARAKDAPATVPVIMEASPYFTGINDVANHDVDHDLYDPADRWQPRGSTTPDRHHPAGGVHLLDEWSARTWVPRGFAWVEVESLGTGGSTGCPTTGGRNETLGPTAVIDWLNGRGTAVDSAGRAVTAPWSDGNVGMIGTSYDGTLPNAVATTGTPGLKAIVAISAISDWYGYYRAGGAVVAPDDYQGEDADVLAKLVLTRKNPTVCAAVIRDLARRQDRRTGDENAFWAERSYLADVGKVRAAVYVAHGLDDWNVKPSQAGRWYEALKAHGVPAKIYWHPGGHGGPPPLNEQVRWFTRYVMGVRNGVDAEPRAIIVNPLTYRNVRYADWPVPGMTSHPTSLSRLELRAGTMAPTLTFTDRPDQTIESFSITPRRANGLAFATRPLERTTRLSGFAAARLRLALGQGNANISLGIIDLDPRGLATVVTRGWADPQNRNSWWRTDPITPGQPMTVTVAFEATEHVFATGHRIGLTILQTDHDFTIRPPAGKTMTVDTVASTITLPLSTRLP